MREFTSPMDALAAESGVPSIFVLDHENCWRLEADLTRDAYQRMELAKIQAPPIRDVAYALFRDNKSHFVSRFFTTSKALLEGHPRGTARFFSTEAEAEEAYKRLGRPPLAKEDW